MPIQTVQDLLDALNNIEDKSKPIFGFVTDNNDNRYEIVPIQLVDDTISDRVDINIHLTEDLLM